MTEKTTINIRMVPMLLSKTFELYLQKEDEAAKTLWDLVWNSKWVWIYEVRKRGNNENPKAQTIQKDKF